MKPLKNNLLAAACIICSFCFTACGNSGSSDGTVKVDTVVNPPDNTTTRKTDSTLPKGAVGMDTVAGGQSTSSGMKDTGNKK